MSPRTPDDDRPVPVIVCDRCGTVTPGRMTNTGGTIVDGNRRLAELRTEGWTITPKVDHCPTCTDQVTVDVP